MKRIPRATDSELLILKILWDHQPATVRFVTEELTRLKGEEVKYTTALKLLQLMHEKGLVERDESERSHRYSATHPREKMQRHVLKDLASKIFGGATADLAMQALSVQKVEPEELRRLKAYIDQQLQNEEKGNDE
ncbi:MAG: BlaI/MecI/CopY family transcriptional regulator [Verrucomicrobiales bacterium]|nr:BlaI/MecI/CopY family transcriptional regulator [Verrucomicrobiales bacterium]